MSDYGLLSRKLLLDVEYEDSPSSSAHAKVPVFAVGREQLYEMFGLYGSNKPRSANYVCNLERLEDCIQDCHYVLVCIGHWLTDGTLSEMVALAHAYETLEQCFYSVACCIEFDAWDLISSHSGLIYDYEVWQICDDYDLYAYWDMSADRYMRETGQNHKFSQAWRLSYEDMADYRSEIGCQMSNDYLSSLKTYNEHVLESLRQLREAASLDDGVCEVSRIEKLERCAACGERLSKPYQYYVEGQGLLCRACFFQEQANRLEEESKFCAWCGSRLHDPSSYYVDGYRFVCRRCWRDYENSRCVHGDTYYTEDDPRGC